MMELKRDLTLGRQLAQRVEQLVAPIEARAQGRLRTHDAVDRRVKLGARRPLAGDVLERLHPGDPPEVGPRVVELLLAALLDEDEEGLLDQLVAVGLRDLRAEEALELGPILLDEGVDRCVGLLHGCFLIMESCERGLRLRSLRKIDEGAQTRSRESLKASTPPRKPSMSVLVKATLTSWRRQSTPRGVRLSLADRRAPRSPRAARWPGRLSRAGRASAPPARRNTGGARLWSARGHGRRHGGPGGSGARHRGR